MSGSTQSPQEPRGEDGIPDFVPFSRVRGVHLPGNLTVGRALFDAIAGIDERKFDTPADRQAAVTFALINAILGLESKIEQLRGAGSVGG